MVPKRKIACERVANTQRDRGSPLVESAIDTIAKDEEVQS
jgi:hypothetical protein